MAAVFPFSAIVGQEDLKRALLLGVIQPKLGGVLIRGTKGIAKSTAVRALAKLLPPLETVTGCPFQRRPGEVIADWPLPADARVCCRPVPLVELPLGATEDRVLGTLHLEKALHGQRVFEPGLLARANRGILYIDEVNLLPDHLVDILLDTAASGLHRLEREGLSLTHPAQFLLIGTMNPEEGELRPQLLDRFGLAVDGSDLTTAADRAEAVRRRLAFEADPAAFVARWQPAEVELAQRVQQAQRLLPDVTMADALVRAACERCLAEGVEGLRADLTVCLAACAWAAFQGRREVEAADVEAVAGLALAHRRRQAPQPPPQGPGVRSQESRVRSQVVGNGTGSQGLDAPKKGPVSEQMEDIAGWFASRVRPPLVSAKHSALPGRWRHGQANHRGRIASSADAASRSIAWAATLRRAAPDQRARGREEANGPMLLRFSDLVFYRKRDAAGCLLLLVVDASGSMASWRRMRQTKAAILALLVQGYQHRDRVALLTFRGQGTHLLLPPTRGLQKAKRVLEELPVGGTTPLAHGLAAARSFLAGHQRRQPHAFTWTILWTDGRTNVPLHGTDPWQDALEEARLLAACPSAFLVVDTETGWPRLHQASQVAQALQADLCTLEEVLGRPLRRAAVS